MPVHLPHSIGYTGDIFHISYEILDIAEPTAGKQRIPLAIPIMGLILFLRLTIAPVPASGFFQAVCGAPFCTCWATVLDQGPKTDSLWPLGHGRLPLSCTIAGSTLSAQAGSFIVILGSNF